MIIIALIVAYLLGSISCAVLVCKFAGLNDPRTEGSGNPGASNILRMHGKTYGIIALVGDLLKGFVAVLVGLTLGVHGFMLGIVAFVAVIGHMYPVFFKFKGGKGVATALGCFLALSLVTFVIVGIVWLAIVATIRYASVASLAACVLAPFVSLFATHNPDYSVGLALIALAVIWRHRENIERLRKGTETKFIIKK